METRKFQMFRQLMKILVVEFLEWNILPRSYGTSFFIYSSTYQELKLTLREVN